MADFSMGTLYDLNKAQMVKEEPFKPNSLRKALKKEIVPFVLAAKDKYFLLLCKERSDYTVFAFENKGDGAFKNAIDGLEECLLNRGNVLSIDRFKEVNDAVEIWVKIDDEACMYYFFPCDDFIIEVGD